MRRWSIGVTLLAAFFVFVRHDPRTLIGLPIGGAMILFLCSGRVRALFRSRT